MDKRIVVKFTGGREGMFIFFFALGPSFGGLMERRDGLRERQGHLLIGYIAVNGLLKGYDALMNLVLDEVQEVLRGMRTIPLPT
jgi:hypothetical protein